ncbi:cysteine hydrolase family protein [Aquibium sp. LZ166]|uniref:Cysteine hydrolase family protein n=1 Tax=Aquibium pacificus TaxID=3153579 RepID=A0ABV3SQ47_9HYPH
MTKTLLEMAGADLTPPRFEEATLVVIDAQNEYVDGALPLPGVGEALGRIAALLEAARNAGAPVVHVQHRGRPGGLFDPEKPAFRIAQQAAPVSGEAVVEKALPNAFAGTNLQEVLEGFGRKQLVLAGFMTHMCVSSTARAALDLGYRTAVVSDASATRHLPAPGGGTIAAADLHAAELAALADRFSIVCRTADLVG